MNKPDQVLGVDLYAAEWRGAEVSPSASFQFVAASDMPVNPIVWLFQDYLEQSALAVLFGPPGKGKSFLPLHLACCVATGKSFHGLEVQQGAVFYIAGEGLQGLARRVRAWSLHNAKSLDKVPLNISKGAAELDHATQAVRVAETIQLLVGTCGQIPALIVIPIDTFARNFGGDENSAADVGRFVREVDRHLRLSWNASVLILHHSGKDSERGARGSSALKGAVDVEYELSRNAKEGLITLTARKMKDAEEPPPLAFELVSIDIQDDVGGQLTSAIFQRVEPGRSSDSPEYGMGKNHQTLLLILRRMHEEIAERLARQGRADHEVLVLHEEWKQQCQAADIPRNRFKEACDALVHRGALRVDLPHVFYRWSPSETEAPLRGNLRFGRTLMGCFAHRENVLKYLSTGFYPERGLHSR